MDKALIVAQILRSAFDLAQAIGGPRLTREAAKVELEALAADPPRAPETTAEGQQAAFDAAREEREELLARKRAVKAREEVRQLRKEVKRSEAIQSILEHQDKGKGSE